MKNIFVGALMALFFCPFEAGAQVKLDVGNQMALRRLHHVPTALPTTLSLSRGQAESKLLKFDRQRLTLSPRGTDALALVRLSDGCSASDLAADGFVVEPLRGGFAVVSCAAADAERLSAHRAVSLCEFNRQRTFHMENARRASGIDLVASGLGLPQAYTGRGVITGIVDGGFDPNHINFRDADGQSRFKYFATVMVNPTGSGIRVTPYSPEALATFSTDDNTQTHGTHTLGIMAGSFSGEATVGVYDEETGTPSVTQQNNPHLGVAPGSTIYASSGASYDALIAYAVDGMLEHRWYNEHDTPIVINLSLGGNQGPHDGSGALTQYLDMMARQEGAIFCISAGNDGDIPIACHKTFTADDNSLATFIRPFVYTDMRYGMVELYSDTSDDFDVSVIIYNKNRKKIVRTFPLNNKQGQIQYICSGEDFRQNETDIVDATFAKAYSGYVGIGGMLDAQSNRFYAAIDYYVVNSDDNPADDTTEAQYTLGFMVTGHDQQRVDAYCDGAFTVLDSYDYEGFADGTNNGSLTDLATGQNTIAVGSYNTREWAASIYGHALGYDGYYKMGQVTEYSAFASLVDGRNLPHLLAPGCLVVSSMSTPYFRNPANGVTDQIVSVKYNDGQRDHLFYPMMGTSMASPVVAGTVALMLEADPALSYDRVREILMETAVADEACLQVADPVQSGAGKLNAYAALKATLEATAVKNVGPDSGNRVVLQALGHRRFGLYLPGATSISAALYNSLGAKVMAHKAAGCETTIDVASLSPGVYILKIDGADAQRIQIK